MFQWLRTKQSMIEEIKSLRTRLSIANAQTRVAQRKLDSANSQLAVFKRIRREMPPLPVTKPVKDDHPPKAPTNTYGSSAASSPSGGFPYGALVSHGPKTVMPNGFSD